MNCKLLLLCIETHKLQGNLKRREWKKTTTEKNPVKLEGGSYQAE